MLTKAGIKMLKIKCLLEKTEKGSYLNITVLSIKVLNITINSQEYGPGAAIIIAIVKGDLAEAMQEKEQDPTEKADSGEEHYEGIENKENI